MSSIFSGLQKHDGKFLMTEDQIVIVARSAQSDIQGHIPAIRYDHPEEFGLRPHEKDTSWKPWHYEILALHYAVLVKGRRWSALKNRMDAKAHELGQYAESKTVSAISKKCVNKGKLISLQKLLERASGNFQIPRPLTRDEKKFLAVEHGDEIESAHARGELGDITKGLATKLACWGEEDKTRIVHSRTGDKLHDVLDGQLKKMDPEGWWVAFRSVEYWRREMEGAKKCVDIYEQRYADEKEDDEDSA